MSGGFQLCANESAISLYIPKCSGHMGTNVHPWTRMNISFIVPITATSKQAISVLAMN